MARGPGGGLPTEAKRKDGRAVAFAAQNGSAERIFSVGSGSVLVVVPDADGGSRQGGAAGNAVGQTSGGKNVARRTMPSEDADGSSGAVNGDGVMRMDPGVDVEDVLDRTLRTLELYTRTIGSLNTEVGAWKVRFGVLVADARACYNMLPKEHHALRTRMIGILKLAGAPFWKSAHLLGQGEARARKLQRKLDVAERLHRSHNHQTKRELERLCRMARIQDAKLRRLELHTAESSRENGVRETRSLAQRMEESRAADVKTVQMRTEFNALKEENAMLRGNNDDLENQVRILTERVATLTDTFSCHVHPVAISAAIDAVHAGSSANDADGSNAFPAMVTAESMAWIKQRSAERSRPPPPSTFTTMGMAKPVRPKLAPSRPLQGVGPLSYYAHEPGPHYVPHTNFVPSNFAPLASYAESLVQADRYLADMGGDA